MYPKTFDDLIYEFQKLPGVGAKTAERYAFTVLGWNEDEISEMILRNEVHEGQNITVNLENENLKFDVN